VTRLAWSRDGGQWPNHAFSRFVQADGMTWHVQLMGQGNLVLLVHGTGSATHSWRALAPLLAQHFRVLALDLPGHGFTTSPPSHKLSLPGMAHSLQSLLAALQLSPDLAVGHSAGAAVLARMSLDGLIAARGLVSLNGAFLPPEGLAGQVFSPLAKLLAGVPFLPDLFAWRASDRAVVERLIRDTGSSIEPAGVTLYGRLVADPRHAAAALAMMANWDLEPLLRDLPRLGPKLMLVAAGNDRAVPPEAALRVRRLVPGSILATLPGLGHLAHEERPDLTAELVLRHAASVGVPAGFVS